MVAGWLNKKERQAAINNTSPNAARIYDTHTYIYKYRQAQVSKTAVSLTQHILFHFSPFSSSSISRVFAFASSAFNLLPSIYCCRVISFQSQFQKRSRFLRHSSIRPGMNGGKGIQYSFDAWHIWCPPPVFFSLSLFSFQYVKPQNREALKTRLFISPSHPASRTQHTKHIWVNREPRAKYIYK